MASRTVFRTMFLTETWLPVHNRTTPLSLQFQFLSHNYKFSKPSSNCGCKINNRFRDYHLARRTIRLYCSHGENPSSFSSPEDDHEPEPPQEAVLKAISEVSRTEGRVGQTTNVVMGGTVTDDSTDEWLTLDQKVNSYPTVRGFTAIGTGGEDFVHAMVIAVESVLEFPIPRVLKAIRRAVLEEDQKGQVKQKISSGGKYVSVNIGPVQVVSSEQVQAVYNAMKRDVRMKYFL